MKKQILTALLLSTFAASGITFAADGFDRLACHRPRFHRHAQIEPQLQEQFIGDVGFCSAVQNMLVVVEQRLGEAFG